MSEDNRISRRVYLKTIAAGAAAAGSVVLFAGCDEGKEELTCTDTSSLTQAQIQQRKTLQYVDDSPHENKTCDNCQLFKPPQKPNTCGGCQVVPGPVHPKGYCNSWVEKQA